jgi:hypothetical protein
MGRATHDTRYSGTDTVIRNDQRGGTHSKHSSTVMVGCTPGTCTHEVSACFLPSVTTASYAALAALSKHDANALRSS